MKALTLTQPWATLVALGAKRIETRSWSTRYRGPIAIHAAKGFPRECRELVGRLPFWTALGALQRYGSWPVTPGTVRLGGAMTGLVDLPVGAIVATARLVACKPTIEKLDPREYGYNLWPLHEAEFGDYSPGRFAWVLADVKPLARPVPAKGALGLWEIDDALLREVA